MMTSNAIGPALRRLIELASPAAISGPAISPLDFGRAHGGLLADWLRILEHCNGFYCFESALHVLPSRSTEGYIGLEEWNSSALWRDAYGQLDPGAIFFAEDIFGNQFGLLPDAVCRLDAETGDVQPFAESPEGWAHRVLRSVNLGTGFPLAHKWQERNGPLPAGSRLLPKVPFVLGGEYSVDNLYAGRAAEGMRVRGYLATQLVDLPDGAQVQYKLVD